MENYYEILGMNFEDSRALDDLTFEDTVVAKASAERERIARLFSDGRITEEEMNTRTRKIEEATATLLNDESRREYDARLEEYLASTRRTRRRVVSEEEAPEKSHVGRKILAGLGITALIATIFIGGMHFDKYLLKGQAFTTKTGDETAVEQTLTAEEVSELRAFLAANETATEAPTETEAPVETEAPAETVAPAETEAPTETTTEAATETTTEAATETVAPAETEAPVEKEQVTIEDMGDIMDDALVETRAQALLDDLNTAGIYRRVSDETVVPYELADLSVYPKYAKGVYTPETMEEIDLRQLQLLDLLISPLNTDYYLFHAAYAQGNDDFRQLLEDEIAAGNVHHVRFDEYLAAYGQNEVFPLVKWITDKRIAINSTLDREEMRVIYEEVGQVMADIMKGNGCTIKVMENGKEVTYRFTSEQLLQYPESALLITTEAQLIFANQYDYVYDQTYVNLDNGETIDFREHPEYYEVVVEDGYKTIYRITGGSRVKVRTMFNDSWEVYNKLNTNGVDENGYPIYDPDIVPLEEIQAWINNGCDFEYEIVDVLINGQTFGQRIQGDMEGMAQNNYAMNHGKTLTK
ncbi:MAG: hypothetical protein IKP07_03200 [Bacilli bacterium]|nr:hypothetical protein [Bacilli bacterium]